MTIILTDAEGRPFERPAPPGPDAPIERKIAWLRKYHATNDRIADTANCAFAHAFRKATRVAV